MSSATKFRLMATELNTRTVSCQHKTSSVLDNISSDNSDRLIPPVRRTSIKEVLTRRMREAGVAGAAEIARRAKAKGRLISETAIKSVLQGATKDPQLSTLDAIAAGLDVSPLRFVADILGIDPDDPALKSDEFRLAWELYTDLAPYQKPKAAPHIAGLLVQLRHIKNLPK